MDRDAEDAVRQRDGYNYDGYTLRVEFPRGSGMARGRGRGGGGRGGPPSRRSENRVLVSGELLVCAYFYILCVICVHLRLV